MTQRQIEAGNGYPPELSPFDDPELATDYQAGELPDLDTVRQALIDQGIDISQGKYQTAIAGRRAKARDLVQASQPNKPPKWFLGLRSFIQNTGNALLLGVMLILSYAAPPVAILGLAYAEIQRVALGVRLFDPPRATLMAVVSVASYLILLVVQAGMNRQNPDSARPVWSLRLVLGQLAYVLGIGRGWRPQQRTRQQLLGIAISRLGLLIILLGTAGSLQTELAAASGAWYRAIWGILAESELMTALSLAGGVTLTAGLLAGLHFTVDWSYSRWVKLIPDTSEDFLAESFDTSAAENQAELMYLLSLLSKSKSKP